MHRVEHPRADSGGRFGLEADEPPKTTRPELMGHGFCLHLGRYPTDRLPTAGGMSATVVVLLDHGRLLCPYHHHKAHHPSYDTTHLPDGKICFHRRT